MRPGIWLLLAAACGPTPSKETAAPVDSAEDPPADADGDGSLVPEDCDDLDSAVHPGAEEICDGLDQDCNGEVDEGLAVVTWYGDLDGDGHAGTVVGKQCGPPDTDAVTEATDCHDADPDVHPGAPEVCNGEDDDCDGLVDDDDPDVDVSSGTPWFTDGDGDGFAGGEATWACTAPPDTTADDADCDDADAAVFPGAPEACNHADDDCDGVVDPGGTCDWTWAQDVMDAMWYPETASQYAGFSVDLPGDVNGDGAQDLLIASGIYLSPPTATAWITDGPGTGAQPLSADHTLATFQVAVPGVDFDRVLGCDLDDDGAVDVALGSAQSYLSDPSENGVVYISSAPSGSYLLDTDADAWLVGTPFASSGLGVSLACGDVDVDGATELIASAPLTGGGVVYVLDGALGGRLAPEEEGVALESPHPGADAGSDLAVADLTGDGIADLVVGASYFTSATLWVGGAYIVHGPIDGDMSLADADTLLVGEVGAGYAGDDVDIVGDQDGDGLPDAIVGSRSAPYAYVVNGPGPAGTSALADADVRLQNVYDRWCDAVTGGDLDGDGFADAVVGTSGFGLGDDHGGLVSVARGPLSGTILLHDVADAYVTWTYTGLGRSLASGDVDGDGVDDLWVGATADSTYGKYTGAGYLFLGTSL